MAHPHRPVHKEVLDHLSECLLAVSPDGHLLFANAPPRKLISSEQLPAAFPLWPEIRKTFTEGCTCSDILTEWAEFTFLAKTLPLDQAGVLIILRDRTEYIQIDQQLTGKNHVIEALRANTHEFLNKLHVIAGLLQIGETQQAVEFINGVSADVENNYQSILRQLQNRTVTALVHCPPLSELPHRHERSRKPGRLLHRRTTTRRVQKQITRPCGRGCAPENHTERT